MRKYDIVIIGAGASGLLCASKLSDLNLNKKILIIDRMNKIGKKLLATGNGRCNLSNKNIDKKNYYSTNTSFIDNMISLFNKYSIIDYFNSLGLKTKLIDNGYYPITEQASSVLEVLRLKIEECSNIDTLLSTNVKDIRKKNCYEIHTDIEIIQSDILIISTGGLAFPIHGSNGSGYVLLEKLNHTKTNVYKALTPLISDNRSLKCLDGLRIKGKVNIFVNNKFVKEETGEIQFTKYGLSGICIFNLSHIASYHKEILNDNVKVNLDLMPTLSKAELFKELINRKKMFSNRNIEFFLTGFLNNKLSLTLYKNLNINHNNKIFSLTDNQLEILCMKIKNLEFIITDTKDFDYAQVTAGGINTLEINQDTFESLINKNLYIIGEVLDIHGDCGGYNLTFAFTSGLVSALHIGEFYDKNK